LAFRGALLAQHREARRFGVAARVGPQHEIVAFRVGRPETVTATRAK